jgi:site-specific DNA recombinase
VQNEARKLSLQTSPDETVLRLARALARQAAREDHEKEHASRRNEEREPRVEGRTPREIAHDLNKERVPPPLGRAWNASTINGNRQRCAGILQNELYVGRLVRNKVRMVKDPDTGKRQSRPNSTSDWQFAEVPSLAIVNPDLFEAAQKRRRERTHTHPSHQRRPRRMLSGLLRCGACGSGMSTNGQDKSGRVRIRCSAAKESGICADAKTFYLDTVERQCSVD